MANSGGPCPKRRRMLMGYAAQKKEAIESGEKFKLDLGRLVSFSGVGWAMDANSGSPAATAASDAASGAPAATAESGREGRRRKRVLQRRHTI